MTSRVNVRTERTLQKSMMYVRFFEFGVRIAASLRRRSERQTLTAHA